MKSDNFNILEYIHFVLVNGLDHGLDEISNRYFFFSSLFDIKDSIGCIKIKWLSVYFTLLYKEKLTNLLIPAGLLTSEASPGGVEGDCRAWPYMKCVYILLPYIHNPESIRKFLLDTLD